MNDSTEPGIIKIWQFELAPKMLQRLAPHASEWLVHIPFRSVSVEVEEFFLRWHSEAHPVTRRLLSDGGVLLAGSYPDAQTMWGKPQVAWADRAAIDLKAGVGKPTIDNSLNRSMR